MRRYTIGKVANLPEDTMKTLQEIVDQTRTSKDDEGVFVQPSVVVAAACQEIQKTDEYTSGCALRSPKIVGFRPGKEVEIDDVEKLSTLVEMQHERHPFQSL